MASASDNFNRADGGLGSAWTALTIAGIAPGSVQISANQVTATGGWGLSRYDAATFAARQRVRIAIISDAADWGIAARIVDVNNFIWLAGNGPNGWAAGHYVGGVVDIYGSGSTTGAGEAMLDLDGSVVRVWIAGVPVLTATAGITSRANPGLYTNAGLSDDWSAADHDTGITIRNVAYV